MRTMTRDQAIALYRSAFWDALRLGEIESQVIATKLFDLAVNVGKVAAVKILQRAINDVSSSTAGIAVDGVMGPATLNWTNSLPWDAVARALRLQAIAFYASIPAAKSQPYLRGWILRALA